MDYSSRNDKRDVSFTYRDDGLAEIFAGIGLVLAALAAQADMLWMAGIYPAILIPAIRSAKERYTVPRLQQLDWRPGKRGGQTLLLLLLAGALAFVVGILAFLVLTGGLPAWLEMPLRQYVLPALGAKGSLPAWLAMVLRQYALPALGVFGAIVWVLKAWFSHVTRFYVYGLVTLSLFAFAPTVGAGLLLPLGLLGAFLTAGGLLTLLRFVRRYPLA